MGNETQVAENEEDNSEEGKKKKKAAAPKEKKGKYDDEKSRKALLDFVKKVTGDTDSDVSFADEYEAVTEVISTGHAELDRMITPIHFEKTGFAGVPQGFVCEFYGPNAGGKSSLAMMLAATVTRKRKDVVYWFDIEGSFVPEWAEIQGVDPRLVMRAETSKCGEEYLEKAIDLAKTGKFPLIVIDSVTALRPQKLLDQNLADNQVVGAGAQMMSRAMPMLVSAAKKGNTAVVLINQVRNKIGVMYGSPEIVPYGEATGFYCSLRVRLQQVGSRKNRGVFKGDDEIGIRSALEIIKSRFGPPHKEMVLPIYYRKDVKPYPIDQLLDFAMSNKIIKVRTKKSDSGEPIQHFSFDGVDELKGIPGFDEFKSELLDRREYINLLGDRVKALGVALDPEVIDYLKGTSKTQDPLEPEFGS